MVSEPASPPNQPSRTEANHSWLRSLRPLAGRRLPARLSAKHVHRLVDPLVEGVADPAFATLLGQIDGRAPYGGNEVEVFFRGEEAFAAMRRAIEAARDEVLLESYIFTDDATGRGVVAALVEAR
ncbi:MAG TPA: hypothetical protein PK413_15670, partial [Thermoanaerobaculia bacterium]|nr:hypothetical protein [Thermoanaerobaculia bacterium]